MAFHPDITRKDTVSLALDTANAAVRIASRQLTGNAGTVEIPNADGTSTIMGVGAGDTGVAPWVGDTTTPGKPLGITATSGNGMIVVAWDGTLDGGIPADFARTAILIDGVEADSMTVAGSRAFGVYESGSVHTVSAIAYDDAHLEDGSSAPNASVASDPISVTVRSSDIDTSKLGIAITKTTVAASASKPGVNRGDLWNQYDKDPNIAGAVLIASWWWDSKQWVALPVAMYLDQLAARDIQANSAVIGLLAAGIITSGLFQTASSGARVKIDSTGITGYDSKGLMTFQIDATTGDVAMIGKFYSGDPSVSRVIIDNDYTKISDLGRVDVDGYVAFESHLSDESPFIGGMHGTPQGTKYKSAGTIITSGVTDSKTPSVSSVQLNSYEGGDGSEGILMSGRDKRDFDKNTARVVVHSDKDGESALIRAYGGTGDGKYADVEARADSDGHYSVAIVATDIFQIDPVTGRSSHLVDGGGAWEVCYTGNFYYKPQPGSGIQALSVRKRFGVVELMGRIAVGGTVQMNSDMGEMIPIGYRPTVLTMIQSDQTQWDTLKGPAWYVRTDGHIIWGPHKDRATDAVFHGIWLGA